MSRLNFDATYLGKLHWREPGSSEVGACVATADEIVCSLHGRAEFYSIGFRKLREGIATPQAIRVVFAQFRADCASGAIRILPLTDAVIDWVETVFTTAPTTTYLRAADASTSPPPLSTASPKSIPTTATSSLPPLSSACAE